MTSKSRNISEKKHIDKVTLKPASLLAPVPVVMLSVKGKDADDVVTLAWCGTVNSDPPMLSVSIRKSRFSHGLLSESGKACVNLVSGALCAACDYCGVKSGRDTDKFADMNLTKVPSPLYGVPMIGESPVCLECSVVNVTELGSHDMFLMKIDGVYVSRQIMNEKGAVDFKKADLVAYCHGEYYQLGGILGFFGYSVAGPDATARRKRK